MHAPVAVLDQRYAVVRGLAPAVTGLKPVGGGMSPFEHRTPLGGCCGPAVSLIGFTNFCQKSTALDSFERDNLDEPLLLDRK